MGGVGRRVREERGLDGVEGAGAEDAAFVGGGD